MKEQFNQLIAETVKPLLKGNGFSKKGMNFYKKKDGLIFLFNFQNSQGNMADQTKFYVNCGIHSTAIDKTIGKPELTEPKEYDCYFRDRISTITHAASDGYFITPATDLPALAATVAADLQSTLLFFDKIQSVRDLTNLMIDKNGLNNYRELFEYLLLTHNMPDLTRLVKGLYNGFGKERRWSIFEGNMTDILKQHKSKETIVEMLNKS